MAAGIRIGIVGDFEPAYHSHFATNGALYHCNYGVDEEYEQQFQAAGPLLSARGSRGEPRAVELPDHR